MKSKHNSTHNEPAHLPPPGPKKQNPQELDKMLDRALEDSMVASDPPAVTQPDVKPGDQDEGIDVGSRSKYDSGKQVGHKI
jgi:hypothetical protein